MSQKLRVGIAGYGVVGRRRHHFIDLNPRLKTAAVCDKTLGGSGVFDNGVRYHEHYKKLLEEDLDLLFVCLPNDMAPEVTIAGLQKSLHVFCEKPPGRDLGDVARVRNCERLNPRLKLKYGFNHRYHDSVKEALGLVRAKKLGDLINLRGAYGKSNFDSEWRARRKAAGGGILLDQGIHMVDMMRLFAGEFEDVHSFVSNGHWKHDVEDNAYALMRTAGGVVAMLHSSATQWRHRFHLEMALSRGTITLSGILTSSKSYGAETLRVAYAEPGDGGHPRQETILYNKDTSWQDEIADFADAVLKDRPVAEGSSLDALKTMQLVYKIYCADAEWRERYGLSDRIPAPPAKKNLSRETP